MLERPSWREHPLTAKSGTERAWYVLLVPTAEEGHDVRSDVIRSLQNQTADFTVVIGYFKEDITEADILAAAKLDGRIRPMKVSAAAGDWTAMSDEFEAELIRLQAERSRKPSDTLCVPLPELIIRR
jgi:hypothetical protein